jgi:hypothetical protein
MKTKNSFFIDGENGVFYMRHSSGKIEPLGGFALIQESPTGKKKPMLLTTLSLMVTIDHSTVLFPVAGRWHSIFTARALRKDGTFLPPKTPEGLVCEPYTVLPTPRTSKQKKKGPRR